jgi:hypothetical protein
MAWSIKIELITWEINLPLGRFISRQFLILAKSDQTHIVAGKLPHNAVFGMIRRFCQTIIKLKNNQHICHTMNVSSLFCDCQENSAGKSYFSPERPLHDCCPGNLCT